MSSLELSLRGQAEWPATRYWLDALNERQACQRTPGDRRLHLERAETHLRSALAEDERFYLAAYNRGIVYVQLQRLNCQDFDVLGVARRVVVTGRAGGATAEL